MDITLTQEQALLAETAGRLARQLGPASPAALVAATHDDEVAAWQHLADVGFLGLRVAQRCGGAGASGVDVALVAEELGASIVTAPFLGSAVLAAELLSAAGASDELLRGVAMGERRLSVALDPTLRAIAHTDALEHRVSPVMWDAAGAEAALILTGPIDAPRLTAYAPIGESASSGEGADLTRTLTAVDPSRSVDIGDLGGAINSDALDRWLALALVGLSADLAGVMRGVLVIATHHAKEREQFGNAIGSFQAVQHLLADQLVAVEAARSVTWYAAWAVDELDPATALLAARTAKAWTSERAVQVTEAAIQVLGGIGITWEHSVHLFLRRALLGRQTLGDEHDQLAEIAAAVLRGGVVDAVS